MRNISNELKLDVGHAQIVQGYRMRNAVPPLTVEDQDMLWEETGLGLLISVKPAGLA